MKYLNKNNLSLILTIIYLVLLIAGIIGNPIKHNDIFIDSFIKSILVVGICFFHIYRHINYTQKK